MKNYQTSTYKIADIGIRLDSPWKEKVSKAFQPFMEGNGKYDWLIKFRPVQMLPQVQTEPLFTNDIFKSYQESSEIFVRQFHHERLDGSAYASAQINIERKQVLVEYLPETVKRFGSGERDFFYIALEKILIEENAVILHAACVDTPLGGILFSGASGAGKSTQADLWCSYGQGRLINGDKAILKKAEDGWRSYGSPYAGSSNCHLAESCRIRAIVFPCQSEQCKLRRLKGAEMFRKVFGNLTMNLWDKDFLDKTGDMTQQLISEIPVYELECIKTKEAVFVLQELLAKESQRQI